MHCARLGFSIHAPLAGSDQYTHDTVGKIELFNPRSPCGERRDSPATLLAHVIFQSTLPLRGATFRGHLRARHVRFSIHAPLAGSDTAPPSSTTRARIFNPRSPCGERPSAADGAADLVLFSIHAPLAGSDAIISPLISMSKVFNPRSPCGERPIYASASPVCRYFQSTLPLRGATVHPCITCYIVPFSIHAPLAGSDCRPSGFMKSFVRFQSTLPLRGATA